MLTKIFAALTALVIGLAAPQPTSAQSPLEARAAEIILYFEGEATAEDIFAPRMLEALPPARLDAVRDQLRGQFGAAEAIEGIESAGAYGGVVSYRFERAIVEMQLAVEPTEPHKITGLLVTGSEMIADDMAAILEEIRALPGHTSLTVARLGETPDYPVEHRAHERMAIGSGFKLWLLAELQRQITAGERRWDEVIPLTHRSLPSGILQNWPDASPVTLHTLATLMISISDNSAADTLLHLLTRERIEAMMGETGHAAAAVNTPFLSTLDMFRLKSWGDDELRRAWLDANPDGRRALLDRLAEIPASALDPAAMQGDPVLIEEIEWFASGRELVRLLAWLDRHADERARAILAINTGIGSAGGDWDYLGFKGGAEPGVLSLSFLGVTATGERYAVTGSWNNPEAPVEEATFATLMSRLMRLLAAAPAPAAAAE
ncbi:MAG: serine hydrolase [Parasphingopyxis sp.]|nr:class A beta-lactamase-related serine hydrolase [Sphingomonadales bacterium]